jgi:hypothetical protein
VGHGRQVCTLLYVEEMRKITKKRGRRSEESGRKEGRKEGRGRSLGKVMNVGHVKYNMGMEDKYAHSCM